MLQGVSASPLEHSHRSNRLAIGSRSRTITGFESRPQQSQLAMPFAVLVDIFMSKAIMKVLIACEFSGIVREAFARRGHLAVSCDLLDTEIRGNHLKGDIKYLLEAKWDLMIAHPPCTHLAVSGARWFKDKLKEQQEALSFVRMLMGSQIHRIAIENPVSIISSRIRKPDQIIQPWQFGHGEIKATCLWLKNLPPLQPTGIVEGRLARVHREPPSPDRWKNRSRTLQGIAEAMAEQWGSLAI